MGEAVGVFGSMVDQWRNGQYQHYSWMYKKLQVEVASI